MATDGTPRYSPEQVQAILERAIKQRGGSDVTGITHTELLETARELDISDADLESAIADYEENYTMEEARTMWKQRRKQKFFEHLRAYLIVNSMLAIFDLLFSGGSWFYWPLFGWGIGLGFDFAEAFYPKEKDIERGAQRMLRKQQKDRKRLEIHYDPQTSDPHGFHPSRKNIIIDRKQGKIIVEKGNKRIEIG